MQKTEAVEAQVDEVKAVMDQNINSMIERGENLQDLEHKTGKLEVIQEFLFISMCRGHNSRSRRLQQKHQNSHQAAVVAEYSGHDNVCLGGSIDSSRYSNLFHIRQQNGQTIK